jgi:hypothetical protein
LFILLGAFFVELIVELIGESIFESMDKLMRNRGVLTRLVGVYCYEEQPS